jgi:hypothetical protein
MDVPQATSFSNIVELLRPCLWPHMLVLKWSPLTMGPSQLNLWIFFSQNSMVPYVLSYVLFVVHSDILDNCKLWIESMMVMLGVSCKLVTSKIHLDWALEQRSAFDICVVKMILVLYLNVLLHVMKFGVVIIFATFNIWAMFCENLYLYH